MTFKVLLFQYIYMHNVDFDALFQVAGERYDRRKSTGPADEEAISREGSTRGVRYIFCLEHHNLMNYGKRWS